MDKSLDVSPVNLNILLGYDGSKHANDSLRLISDLCNPQKFDSSKIYIKMLAVFTPRQIDNRIGLEKALEKSRAYLGNLCFQVSTHLVLGYPAEKLVETAQQENPDLIVVGAKGLRSALGILLGGVAQQVVEYACCPVLVVRAPYQGIRNALIVTDGSTHGQYAVRYMGEFPLPASTQIHIMHVLPPVAIRLPPEMIAQTWPVGPEIYTPIAQPPSEKELEWQREEEALGQELLDKSVALLGVVEAPVKRVLTRGDAASEILQYIKDNKIDLVIAGSRGLSQFRGWLLGSVSRKLVHYSPCSVLIIKSKITNTNNT